MVMSKRPPLDEWLSLFQATIAVEGVTTGAGAGAGTSIIDAALIGAGANSFVSMLMVLYPGEQLNVDSQDITAFNTVTGEVTYAGAYKGVAAAIPAGVAYKIVTFRFVPAEVAALVALVTDLTLSQSRQLFTMDFWSNSLEEVVITAAQVTTVLTTVVVHDLPVGATVVIAKLMYKFRMVENTNVAENSLDHTAAMPLRVDDSGATGYVDGIDFVDEMYKIAASSREGGDVVIGDNNIYLRVDGNDTYSIQWYLRKAHLANIQFNEVQFGLKIWYSV